MIKVEVIESFSLGAFKEIKNIKRSLKDEDGKLFLGDTFECTKAMSDYLTNKSPNPANRPVVKVIGVIPDIEPKMPKIKTVEQKEEKKPTTRKTINKKNIAKKN